MEVGAYVYRESDTYNDVSYPDSNGDQSTVSIGQYTRSVAFESDKDGNLDTPMYLTNQAMFSQWYRYNEGKKDDNQWQVYLNLLYQMVPQGLGEEFFNQKIFQRMELNYFYHKREINRKFIPNNHVFEEVKDALFDDPYYGLS